MQEVRSFRVLIESGEDYDKVMDFAQRNDFTWFVNGIEKKDIYAIVFYPSEGKKMKRQYTKKVPNTSSEAYLKVQIVDVDQLNTEKIKKKSTHRRTMNGGYSVKATCKRKGNEHIFKDCKEAVAWLKKAGKHATAPAIYQAIKKRNGRKTAYGFIWQRVENKNRQHL